MGLLDGFERLINEHGSSAILKERISLAEDKYAALESENAVIRSENETLKLDNQQLREQVGYLEKQLIESTHGSHLTFDQKTGTWIDEATSLRYCAKCKTQNTFSPMRDYGHGWHCAACGSTYRDPSRHQEAVVVSRRSRSSYLDR